MTYIMDTREEGRRVERKTDRCLTVEQLRWARVGEGSCVLDLGCAAGTTSRMIARLVGTTGRVVGVDSSANRLGEGWAHPEHHPTIEYRYGDAASIPAADGEFDVSWARFLFEYLPDPNAALVELIRVTKPGGAVCVSDIDGNCTWHHPCEPSLQAEISEALVVLGDRFNPRIGLSLYAMFADAGLRELAVDVRPYHVIAGAIDAEREEHWRMKLEGVCTTLRARGWSHTRARLLSQAFLDHLRDARTFTYSTLISVRGIVEH